MLLQIKEIFLKLFFNFFKKNQLTSVLVQIVHHSQQQSGGYQRPSALPQSSC